MGFAQNISNSFRVHVRRIRGSERRAIMDFDYLYSIITIAGWSWHFLLYSPGKISKASDIVYSIEFTKKAKPEL